MTFRAPITLQSHIHKLTSRAQKESRVNAVQNSVVLVCVCACVHVRACVCLLSQSTLNQREFVSC